MPVVALSPLHTADGLLTIDVLARLVSSTVLNPSHSILLPFAALLRASGIGAARSLPQALDLLRKVDWPPVFAERTVQLALAVWGVGLALTANAQLNRAVRNNFARSSKRWNWAEEVVLVTGGAGGLGSEVVKRLAGQGIKVVVFDLAPLSFEAPPGVTYVKVDISSAAAVQEAAAKVRESVGHPTVLINMAGIVRANSILDMSQREIDLTYDINVKAHYYTVQAFLPEMIKNGHGHIVTIASSTAYHQAANGVAYCSSKAAALSFHEGLTEELRHTYRPHAHARQIRTSVICPAHIKTAMFDGFENEIPSALAPSLEVGTVAGLVVATVLSGESQHIVEPLYAKFTPMARGLPAWMYSAILAFTKDAMAGVRVAQAIKAGKSD
ncbi:hypothetical protein JCM5296_001010 [Sporobolomyces johnsonii]